MREFRKLINIVEQGLTENEQTFDCVFCGKEHRSPAGLPDGGDIACCGEIGHVEPHKELEESPLKKSNPEQLKQTIQSLLNTKVGVFQNQKTINGISVRELKDKLRGMVPQNQKDFVDFIRNLGFDFVWGENENKLFVFNPIKDNYFAAGTDANLQEVQMLQEMDEYILKMIRQNLGYDEKDLSHDKEILAMSPMQRLRCVAGWKLGDRSWANQFIEWAKDCGFKIGE